jgi:hypothetical protein
MAMDSLGEAWVDVHGRVDKDFDEEVASGIRKELKDVEKEVDKAGKDIGDTLSTSIAKEVDKNGPTVGRDIGRTLTREVNRRPLDFVPNLRWNRRGRNGRFISRVAHDIEEDIGTAFEQAASSSGGLFGKVGQGIADAVGSIFNVSGKSPLIAVLIPAITALIGLIVGAIQAANSLVAVIATIPTLIGAIALQAGVLFLAFKGVGTAIQGAFAAKNAKELQTAIAGLTPSAQAFVKTLLPLRDFFSVLKAQLQESFFKAFGDTVPKIAKSFAWLTDGRLASIATSLGDLFEKIGLFFASSTFVTFVKEIIPATRNFLRTFGDSLVTFLTGLIQFATAMIPFLTVLGKILGGILFQLGVFFTNVSKDPATTKWLMDMQKSFQSLIELVGALIDFIFVFADQLNKAGGQKVLDEIVKDVELLTFLLGSDFGRKAFEGLVHFVIIALEVTTGLIALIFLLFGLLETTAEFIKNGIIPAIGFAAETVWHWLDVAGGAIRDFVFALGTGIADAWHAIANFFIHLWESLNNGKGRFLLLVTQLPAQITAALGNLAGLLFRAGQNLIQGFINGIRSMFGFLANTGSEMIHKITQFLPGSPAEDGPLSGKGYSLYRGQNLIRDFARGIAMEAPTLQSVSNDAVSNIVFGANSIQVGFQGALPTTQQAQTTGSAVASGITGGLLARDTRLAVRTI